MNNDFVGKEMKNYPRDIQYLDFTRNDDTNDMLEIPLMDNTKNNANEDIVEPLEKRNNSSELTSELNSTFHYLEDRHQQTFNSAENNQHENIEKQRNDVSIETVI